MANSRTDLCFVNFFAISGTVLNVVKSMLVTSENYQIVRIVLVKRYKSRRVLTPTYLDKIFNFKLSVNESVVGLNEFLQSYIKRT